MHDTRTYGIWYNRGRFDSVLAIPKLIDTVTTPATGVPQIFSFGTGPNSFYYYDGFHNYNLGGRDTSTGPFVALSPAAQQTGYLNLSQSSQFGANLTINNTLITNNGTGNVIPHWNLDSGLLARFTIGLAGNKGPVANTGSDLFFGRNNDAGTLIDVPLKITRSTGTALFSDTLGAAGFVNFQTKMLVGSTSNGALAQPPWISLGTSYGNGAGGVYNNGKLRLYDGGSYYIGLGVTGSSFEFNNSSTSSFNFYNAGILNMSLATGGVLSLTNNLRLPNNAALAFRNVQNTADIAAVSVGNTNKINFYGASNTLDSAGNLVLAGNVNAGVISASNFSVTSKGFISAAPINSAHLLIQSTGGLNRWGILTVTAEGGSNTGSDLAVNSYSDAGSPLFNPISIRRATGAVTTNDSLTAAGVFRTTGTVRLDIGTDAPGEIYYRNTSGNTTRLPIGAQGQVLTVNSSALPDWENVPGGSAKFDTVFGLPFTFTTTSTAATPITGLSFTASPGKVGLYAFEIFLNTQSTGGAGIFMGTGGTYTGGMNAWCEGGTTSASLFSAAQTTTNNGLTTAMFNNYNGGGWIRAWGTVVFIGSGETFTPVVATLAGTTITVLPAGTFMHIHQI